MIDRLRKETKQNHIKYCLNSGKIGRQNQEQRTKELTKNSTNMVNETNGYAYGPQLHLIPFTKINSTMDHTFKHKKLKL